METRPESHYFSGMDRYEDFLLLEIYLDKNKLYFGIVIFLHNEINKCKLFTCSLLNCPFLRDNGHFIMTILQVYFTGSLYICIEKS